MIVYMYIILICKSDNYIVGMIYAVSPGIFYTLRYPRYDLIEVNPTTGKVTRSTRISDWGKWRHTFYKFTYYKCVREWIFFLNYQKHAFAFYTLQHQFMFVITFRAETIPFEIKANQSCVNCHPSCEGHLSTYWMSITLKKKLKHFCHSSETET